MINSEIIAHQLESNRKQLLEAVKQVDEMNFDDAIKSLSEVHLNIDFLANAADL